MLASHSNEQLLCSSGDSSNSAPLPKSHTASSSPRQEARTPAPRKASVQLKSRHQFVPAALELLNTFALSGIGVAQWVDYKWNVWWRKNTSRFHSFITNVNKAPSRKLFYRPAWVRLNSLQTGVGLFHSKMNKWDMTPTAACECVAKKQTAEHVITSCPTYHHANVARTLSAFYNSLVPWLTNTCPDI